MGSNRIKQTLNLCCKYQSDLGPGHQSKNSINCKWFCLYEKTVWKFTHF